MRLSNRVIHLGQSVLGYKEVMALLDMPDSVCQDCKQGYCNCSQIKEKISSMKVDTKLMRNAKVFCCYVGRNEHMDTVYSR